MIISKEFSPELQRVLRDIKQELEKVRTVQVQRIGSGNVFVAPSLKPLQAKSTPFSGGIVNGDVSINGTLLVNGSQPIYTETNLLDPSVADYSAAGRAIGTIYQNTNDTMLDVRVSVKIE